MFINPLELLELQFIEPSKLNNSVIKKAKRRLYAEIDLSDKEYLVYKNLNITKSDCEKAIDDLANPMLVEFYYHLTVNSILNDYLVNGDEKIYSSFKQESIYKLPEFIVFISPYYSSRFDKSLLKGILEADEHKVASILRTQQLVNNLDINTAYRSLSNEISNRIEQTEKITRDINDEIGIFSEDNIDTVIVLIEKLFVPSVLNLLPTYFQSQINKIAATINYLQLAVWNELDSTYVPLRLLELILKLNIESISKPTFQKNYDIVKKKHEERLRQEINAPTLKRWAEILLNIHSLKENVDKKSIESKEALSSVRNLIQIDELNSLPDFASELRTQLAYSIRNLSISCWNNQNDIISALDLINISLKISIPVETYQNLLKDKKDLEEIEVKNRGYLICYFCGVNPPDDKSSFSQDIYKETHRSSFPRSVRYSQSKITLTRCSKCEESHNKASTTFRQFFFPVFFIGILFGLYVLGYNDESQNYFGGLILGLLCGGIVGAIVAHIAGSVHISKLGIKSTSNSDLASHPLVKNLWGSGWKLDKPTA